MKLILSSIAVAAMTAGSFLSIAEASTPPSPASSRGSFVTTSGVGASVQEARRGRGKDDAPGDDHGRRGNGRDDGANHA